MVRRLLALASLLGLGLVLGLPAPLSAAGAGGTRAEQRTARHLDSVRGQPPLLLAFLRSMPKGGDLHSHLSGAVYAESMIGWAAADGLCVERATGRLLPGPCDPCDKEAKSPAVACALGDAALYGAVVDSWSMRNFRPERESGHDRFFATFGRFDAALERRAGDAFAEAAARAAADRLQYLELMRTADGRQAAELGRKTGWDDDLGRMRERLLAGGLPQIVAATRTRLDGDEARMRELLACGTPRAAAGCAVAVRQIYQVLRGLPRESVFAQLLLGFELARADARFVGLNLVMPEDGPTAMRDFALHMEMIHFLRPLYAEAHVTLHAGELAPGLVPPEGLRSHIRGSVERGHAERIGHGVDVMNEEDPFGLLRLMAERRVLVEICLTSNDVILGVRGEDHPLPVYMRHGVPVTIATDDQGVSRSDMTQEYLRAVRTYGLSWPDLKGMARRSLEHAFLPGPSLWRDARKFVPVAACAGERPGAAAASATPGCALFLRGSERARQQWELERRLAELERLY